MEIELITIDNPCIMPKTDNATLLRDLKLDLLLNVIANGDEELLQICRQILLQPSTNKAEILKRQTILKDGVAHTELFHTVYHSAVQSLKKIKDYDDITKPKYNCIIPIPKKILTQVEIALTVLDHLEFICGCIRKETNFISETFSSFCKEITDYYTDSYIIKIRTLLHSLGVLKTTDAVSVGMHLGKGLKMTDLILHRILCSDIPTGKKKSLLSFKPEVRLKKQKTVLSNNRFDIHERSIYEIKIENTTIENEVREIIDASLTSILKTVSNFNHCAIRLLEQIKLQFGFYCGGLNLYKYLSERKIKVCFPEFSDTNKVLTVSELTDLFLAINGSSVITNSVSYEGKQNWIITGVNQGGKTTFLRSIGIAQLLAQSGYFIAAAEYVCNIYRSIFTHFPENEDVTLKYGLLEQELLKLNTIISQIAPESLLLLNETFSTTTDYDAAYLANELLNGILDSGITCFYVTHNYEFSQKLYQENNSFNVFLWADREEDGSRNFRLREGKPLKTGYALDLYHDILHDIIR